MCSWRPRFVFHSENKCSDSLFPFSCLGSWKWDDFYMALGAFGTAPSGMCYIAWKSLHQKRQKKFFLVSKSFCFADSQSLLCEVDNWVYKSYIFPSSFYVTNLILYFGFNAAAKEGICLLFSSLPLPPQPVFHSSCVLCPGMWRVLHLGRKWLELLWKLIFFSCTA